MELQSEYTLHGFVIFRFRDDYGDFCSLQESSSVDPHIWLGMDKDSSGEAVGITVDGHKLGARMHLSQDQIAMLIPLLQHFVDMGGLPEPDGAAKELGTPQIESRTTSPEFSTGQMVRISEDMYPHSIHPDDQRWRGHVVKLMYQKQDSSWEAESAEYGDWIILDNGQFVLVDEAQS